VSAISLGLTLNRYCLSTILRWCRVSRPNERLAVFVDRQLIGLNEMLVQVFQLLII
jgi:hypothetical protein